MSQTNSLPTFYTELQSASTDRERLYSAKGMVDWPTFATSPAEQSKKVVKVTKKDFAFGTLRITAPCLLRLTENIDFNPNAPLTWLNHEGKVIAATWDSDAFSQATDIDPKRTSDWFPNLQYVTGHQLSDGTTVPSWGDNMTQYFKDDAPLAYRLGFFAAIAVETDGVIVDLNGFTLCQHPMHALMQRFFAIIELGDQPFIPGEGPATNGGFGKDLRPAHQVTIKNGVLGLSSHHGIHGNNCHDVLIEDVTFRDHEVAAISLNGAQRVAIVNCQSLGSRQSSKNSQDASLGGVPVLGTFSAARFAQATAQSILHNKVTSPIFHSFDQQIQTSFLSALKTLSSSIDTVFNEVIFQDQATPSNPLFRNPLQLTDGPSYGILCSPRGVAVGPFLERRSDSTALDARDYYLQNVTMKNITIAPREIISITGGDRNGNQVDMAGAVFQLFGLEGQPGCRAEDGTYAGTILSDMQIRLAQVKALFIQENPDFEKFFGTLSIENEIVIWALAGHDPHFLHPFPQGTPPYKLVHTLQATGGVLDLQDSADRPMGYSVNLRCNGDSMHHVHKGTVAYRFDGISGLLMKNCSAKEIVNHGPAGSLLGGRYQNGSDGGHEGQGTTLIGYTGSDAYGIRLSACEYATLNQCHVESVSSDQGSSYGLYVSNGSRNVLLNDCAVNTVRAGTKTNATKPWAGANTIPQAFALKTDSDTSEVSIEHCTTNGEWQPHFPKPSNETQVDPKPSLSDRKPSLKIQITKDKDVMSDQKS